MITGLLMSINDPRWGNNSQQDDDKRGNDQGPPDLEEIWRDFNNRLGGLFGRSGGSGSSDGSGRPGGKPRWGGLGIVVLVVLLLWLGSGLYTVDASQRGVVMRFGKFHEVRSEGLQWHLPYPIESVELVDVTRIRTVEVGYRSSDHTPDLHEALMLTDDENIVNIQFAVQYTVSDAADYLFSNKDPDAMVKQVAESAMREIVGKSKMDFVLYEGREAIAHDAQVLIQSILNDYKVGAAKSSGIQIAKVTMANAQPPEQVQAAFNDAVKAVQDADRLKNEGLAYSNDVVPRARGAASRLHEEALGYAGRVVAQAEGDASRFKQILAAYSQAPDVTRSRMYIEAMQEIYSHATKIMVDTKGNGNMLYLPLDKLMGASAAGSAKAGTSLQSAGQQAARPAGDTSASTSRDADLRSRDSLSRDRGER